MFPNRLLTGTQSNAERKVFHALKDLLPETYAVFHSIPVYHQSDHGGRLADGEIDFLVAHPDKGVLVIEVKGGGISHDSASGEWMSTDIQGCRHFIKNPYEQGKGYKYVLIQELRDCRLTRTFTFPTGHAVWFPDIDLTSKSLGFSTNLEDLTLDARALPVAEHAIEKLFETSLGTLHMAMPGHAGIEALIRHLAPNWEIASTLSAKIMDEQRQILEATKSQYKVLSLLGRLPRALIRGCAGSGKTLLALEKARRLADDGQSVLVVCFNKRLAAWIQERVSGAKGVQAFHFHGLCTHMCREANLPVPYPDPVGDQSSYYQHTLPESLIDALAQSDLRFDALVIDEGQDFNSAWWLPMQECLKDPNDGTFYIFFDDNQVIYSQDLEFPFREPIFSLLENCRNTKAIHKQVTRFYRGDGHPEAIGPEGGQPEFIVAEDELRAVRDAVKRLVHTHHIRLTDIVILTPLSLERSFLREGDMIGNIRLSWERTGDVGRVFCCTIHSFKGLESPVVILCELSGLHPRTQNEMLYVGMSRARHHLVAIVRDQKYVEPGETIYQAGCESGNL
jgi:superfamily I DNA/RNA helicase